MTKGSKTIDLVHQKLRLLPERAIYWQKKKTLLVADLHIGKSTHFRKHGIAVPARVATSNLDKLSQTIENYDIEHIIILGDLFHSKINQEWEVFVKWRKDYTSIEVSLVIGNHDILKKEQYHSAIINVFRKLSVGPFLCIHDIHQVKNKKQVTPYILSGHVHPAVELRNKGRQRLKLPCFYFGQNYGILPAFGSFTGTHIIKPKENDQIFIIAEDHVLSTKKL